MNLINSNINYLNVLLGVKEISSNTSFIYINKKGTQAMNSRDYLKALHSKHQPLQKAEGIYEAVLGTLLCRLNKTAFNSPVESFTKHDHFVVKKQSKRLCKIVKTRLKNNPIEKELLINFLKMHQREVESITATNLPCATMSIQRTLSLLGKPTSPAEDVNIGPRSNSLNDVQEIADQQEAKKCFEIAKWWVQERPQDYASLKPLEMIKLSRRKLWEMKKQILPRSVLVVKGESGEFKFFAKVHNKPHPSDPNLPKNEAKKPKLLAHGGLNKILWVEKEGGFAVLRQPLHQHKIQFNHSYLIQFNIEDQLKDRPDLFLIPEGRQPTIASVGARIPQPTDSAPCSYESGEINPFIKAGSGAKFLGFKISTLHLSKTKYKTLSTALLQKILRDISEALTVAHSKGIAHMDLKLDNLLIEVINPELGLTPENVRVKLHDFDTSVFPEKPVKRVVERGGNLLNLDETEEIATAGTLLMQSPEQVLGDAYNGHGTDSPKAQDILNLQDKSQKIEALKKLYSRMDCYSFALIAHLIMTGKSPKFIVDTSRISYDLAKKARIWNMNIDWDNKSELTLELEKNFRKRALKRGFDPKLIDMVLQGFSTNPAKRPTMAQFFEYFSKN